MVLLAVSVLWIAFLGSALLLSWMKATRTRCWLLCVLGAVLLSRLLQLLKAPFLGLEYEDAYEYIYAGLEVASAGV